jgi:two-component system cell cycle response regulator DivK
MKKVLVVDDNPVSRELIREVLEGPQQKILEAEDGEEALEKVLQEEPDLVLLDIQLPVLDGYEVLRRIRGNSRFARLPVVALTAFAMREDCEKALALGFDEYVTKPIDAASLRLRVRSILGSE